MSECMEYFGAVPSPYDVRDYVACVTLEEDFPEQFSLFEKFEPSVKNQGCVGSCVAHSLSTLVEWFNGVQEGTNTVFSTSYIYGNRTESTHKGSGMIMRDAIKNVCKYGDPSDSIYPGNVEVPKAITNFEERNPDVDKIAYPNRISTYYRLTSKAAIKAHLMNVGPVVFSIPWKQSYHVDKENCLRFDSDVTLGFHCMIIVGWNKDGWLIQNSWGKSFGDNGRVTLPYSVDLWEAWGITDDVKGESLEIKKTSKFAKVFYKIINAVVNLLLKFKKK